MNEKKMKSSRKRTVVSHRKSIRTISLVLLVLLLALGFSSFTLQARNKDYIAQEAKLEKQLMEEQQRTAEIAEYKEYVKTSEFIEQIAKEKLGLVYPDEIVLKPTE